METKTDLYRYQREKFNDASYQWSATMVQVDNYNDVNYRFDFRVSCNESDIIAEASVFTDNGWKNICKKSDLDLPKEIENLNPYLKSNDYKVWFRLMVEREMLIYVDNLFFPDICETTLRTRINEITVLLSENEQPSFENVREAKHRTICQFPEPLDNYNPYF